MIKMIEHPRVLAMANKLLKAEKVEEMKIIEDPVSIEINSTEEQTVYGS